MEITKKIVFFLFIAASSLATLSAQLPSQAEQLRVQIWAELDAFPGSFEDDAPPDSTAQAAENSTAPAPFRYAIERAKEIAPFFMGGMISGWNFDYVPSDKVRNVEEFFEFEEQQPLNRAVNPVSYKRPLVEDGKLLCWAYCDRTPAQQLAYRRWSSVTHPRIRGKGTAPVEDGFAGVQAASAGAIKNAVREYWRIYLKNKPKEITGTVLLIGVPRVYIYEGQYVADLEFFLETDTIVKYSYY